MYNAKKYEKIEAKTQLPKDGTFDGVIISMRENKIKNLIKNSTGWKNADSEAIEITVEICQENKDPVQINQIFSFKSGEDGQTLITEGSNLDKYHEKYKKLPEVRDQLKVYSTGQGFGKVKLD